MRKQILVRYSIPRRTRIWKRKKKTGAQGERESRNIILGTFESFLLELHVIRSIKREIGKENTRSKEKKNCKLAEIPNTSRPNEGPRFGTFCFPKPPSRFHFLFVLFKKPTNLEKGDKSRTKSLSLYFPSAFNRFQKKKKMNAVPVSRYLSFVWSEFNWPTMQPAELEGRFPFPIHAGRNKHPTDPFTTPLEPQNPSIDELYVVRKRQSTDFEAINLWKGQLDSLTSANQLLNVRSSFLRRSSSTVHEM